MDLLWPYRQENTELPASEKNKENTVKIQQIEILEKGSGNFVKKQEVKFI